MREPAPSGSGVERGDARGRRPSGGGRRGGWRGGHVAAATALRDPPRGAARPDLLPPSRCLPVGAAPTPPTPHAAPHGPRRAPNAMTATTRRRAPDDRPARGRSALRVRESGRRTRAARPPGRLSGSSVIVAVNAIALERLPLPRS